MNDYWHIPRASLSSSSASSAVSSASSTQRSNRSHIKQKLTPTHYRQQQQHHHIHHQPHQPQEPQRYQQQNNLSAVRSGGRRSDSELNNPHASAASTTTAVLAAAKRGSRSSQGSNDSNNSTRSAASGSLLLTAANLERMTEIHRKQQKHHQQQQQHLNNYHHASNLPIATVAASSTYNANLVHATRADYQLATVSNGLDVKALAMVGSASTGIHPDQTDAAGNAVIDIDPNLNFIKTKDLDTVSIASSMHFTMVNGDTGANKKTKKSLCDRGRQVTVLIISMSTVFLLLIMGMVYALEMRAREMPQS